MGNAANQERRRLLVQVLIDSERFVKYKQMFAVVTSCCCSYVGELLVAAEVRHREDSLYLLDINDFFTIDSMRRGNISRFFNHSCKPVRHLAKTLWPHL
eukprot:SAG31_NODE_6182_length_2134_cov_1.482064_2_plen_99_part_00